jgi:hypothetical protein
MNSSAPNELFRQLTTALDACHPADWGDIHALLEQIGHRKKPLLIARGEDGLALFSKGTAFVTFSYGIDGVTIEISKYARILNELFAPSGQASIHLIGGKFAPQAKSVLGSAFVRRRMNGINGWDKWEGGKWFEALFRTDMKPGSPESAFLFLLVRGPVPLEWKQMAATDHQCAPVQEADGPIRSSRRKSVRHLDLPGG